MKRILLSLFLIVAPLIAQAQDFPAYKELYVNDFADLLSTSEEEAVRAKLKALRETHGIEFTVVTIELMSSYGYVGAIEPFATGLFNSWGVGDSRKNDGVMMLISRFDREMRLEVGSGYGSTKNAPMKRIIDTVILPEFRNDAYASGIMKGVDAVIFDLTGVAPDGVNPVWYRLKSWMSWLINTLHVFLVPIGGALVGIPLWLFKRWRRYRPRICPIDRSRMDLLAEHWDDNYLQEGQLLEEQLNSVDYDVWECPECAHRTIEAYKSLFSRFGACRSCGFKTMEGETTILEHASTTKTGRKRIDYSCRHCNDTYSVEKTIPKKSSSSSGSSSFGGGSSSGGGASGSW